MYIQKSISFLNHRNNLGLYKNNIKIKHELKFLNKRYLSSTKSILYNLKSENTSHSKTLFKPEIHEERLQFFRSYIERFGKDEGVYPPFKEDIEVKQFIEKYSYLSNGERLKDHICILSGRIMSKRTLGKKLIFYMIKNNNVDLQVMCSTESVKDSDKKREDFDFIHRHLKRGDIISIKGTPYRSKTGELTIEAIDVRLLSPCLHDFPDYNSVLDKEIRYRNRHVDLMTTSGVKNVFITRSKIIRYLRKFLEDRGFIEVETPILSINSGGASARPFQTHLNALKTDLYLRIAPELYLKQLVVGGMDRVFEIGKSFRNEGIDHTHNPEFTMCEFYQAYTDYNGLMETTQELLSFIVKEVTGDTKIYFDVPAKLTHKQIKNVEIDFSKPFERISVREKLEEICGMPISEINDPNNLEKLVKILKEHQIELEQPFTTVRVLDTIIEYFIEVNCIQPTFLYDIPIVMSPLAREHRQYEGSTERFELFVGRMELCNAYTELNNPMEQRERFQKQVPDGESVKTNEDWYCGALEWGLPPTGGWGMGIDRLTMLLTNKNSIKEVILFPFMKPET